MGPADTERGGNDSPPVRANKAPPARKPARPASAAASGEKKPAQKKSM
eukprot:COSAG02_NODE_50150_length_322_cov_0.919283_1_plen_47_part_01